MAAIDASSLHTAAYRNPAARDSAYREPTVGRELDAQQDSAAGERSSAKAVKPKMSPASQSLGQAERIAAAESLVEQFHADVFRYSYWLCGCRNAAEDISQETFLRAYRGLHALREMSAAKGWLLTIARHEYLRWLRKTSEVGSDFTVEKADEQSHTLQLERQDWLRQALSQLPSEFRVVLLMYYFEQQSYAQIAQELDIPLGTVMSRLSRARQHLRNALEQLETPKRER